MSEFSLILVLQNKTSKIINVMGKYRKKGIPSSKMITHFLRKSAVLFFLFRSHLLSITLAVDSMPVCFQLRVSRVSDGEFDTWLSVHPH